MSFFCDVCDCHHAYKEGYCCIGHWRCRQIVRLYHRRLYHRRWHQLNDWSWTCFCSTLSSHDRLISFGYLQVSDQFGGCFINAGSNIDRCSGRGAILRWRCYFRKFLLHEFVLCSDDYWFSFQRRLSLNWSRSQYQCLHRCWLPDSSVPVDWGAYCSLRNLWHWHCLDYLYPLLAFPFSRHHHWHSSTCLHCWVLQRHFVYVEKRYCHYWDHWDFVCIYSRDRWPGPDRLNLPHVWWLHYWVNQDHSVCVVLWIFLSHVRFGNLSFHYRHINLRANHFGLLFGRFQFGRYRTRHVFHFNDFWSWVPHRVFHFSGA